MPPKEESVAFTEFSATWLTTWAIVRLKSSGYREYESVVRLHLEPEFGRLSLTDISPERIQAWIAQMISQGCSPATARNRLIVLKRVLATAVEYGLLRDNPVEKVASPRVERREMMFLSPPEIRQLIEATPASWRLLISLPALCGLRKSELLALEWPDIDIDAMTISITKSVRGGIVSSPKTRTSVSVVPLPKSLLPLIQQRRRQAGHHELVFCRADGSQLSDATPNRVLNRALKKAGLPHVRFHDLRHSWAVAHLRAGTDIKTLAHLGRWASTQTLLDTYAHVMPAMGGDAVENVDRLISDS